MKDFAAIDFETANGKRTSVCSVGVVVVRGGEVTDTFYRLIRPRPNFYSRFTTAIHGLTYEDTADAPDFASVWREIEPRIAGLPLVIRPIQGALASEQLKALEFAARVHGAPPLTVYRKVTLPLVRGQILSGLLLGISRASGEVGITMMVGGNISDRTNTLSLEIWNAVSRADFDVATTLCLLLSAFTLLIFIVLDRLQRRAGAL